MILTTNIGDSLSSTSPERINFQAKFCDFDEFISLYKHKIPGGGIFLETDKRYSAGTKVYLNFSLTSNGRSIIKGSGEVVSQVNESNENAGGLIVRFLELDDKSNKLLASLVENYL